MIVRKFYEIWIREVSDILTYYSSETIKKWYCLGVNNEFFTKEEAVNYLLNKENIKKLDENCSYFIQEVFKLIKQ